MTHFHSTKVYVIVVAVFLTACYAVVLCNIVHSAQIRLLKWSFTDTLKQLEAQSVLLQSVQCIKLSLFVLIVKQYLPCHVVRQHKDQKWRPVSSCSYNK